MRSSILLRLFGSTVVLLEQLADEEPHVSADVEARSEHERDVLVRHASMVPCAP
jgi:hypothetical protein